MSYDVSIGDQWFNYTWNLSRFFRDHMPEGINGLDGLTGRQASDFIGSGLNAINRSYCRNTSLAAEYDDPNGWGSVIGALIFLGRIQAACASNPRKKVRVS